MIPDDEMLLREYLDSGSEQAFSTLVAKHADLVTRIVRSRISDDEACRDVIQTVFSLMARKARSLVGHPAPAGWLVKTAVFESKKHTRREASRMKRESSHVELEVTDSTSFSEEEYALVDDAITRLPERFREPLLMRYYGKESFRAIGEKIGKSEGATQKLVSRAVDKLRALVRRESPNLGSTTAVFSVVLAASLTPGKAAGSTGAIAVSALKSSSSISYPTLLVNTIYTMTATQLKIAAIVGIASIPIILQWSQNRALKERISEIEHHAANGEQRTLSPSTIPMNSPRVNVLEGNPEANNVKSGGHPDTADLLRRFDIAAVSGGRRSDEWRDVIRELRNLDSPQLLRLLDEIGRADYGTLAKRDAAHVVVEELTHKNPAAVAEYILKNQGSEALGATLKEWAQNAPDEAMGWLVAKLRSGELNPKDTASRSHGNPFSEALSGVAITDPAKALSTWAAVPHDVDASSLESVVGSLRTPAIREEFVAELQEISNPERAGIAAEAYARGLGQHLGLQQAAEEINSLGLSDGVRNRAIIELASDGLSHGGSAARERAGCLETRLKDML